MFLRAWQIAGLMFFPRQVSVRSSHKRIVVMQSRETGLCHLPIFSILGVGDETQNLHIWKKWINKQTNFSYVIHHVFNKVITLFYTQDQNTLKSKKAHVFPENSHIHLDHMDKASLKVTTDHLSHTSGHKIPGTEGIIEKLPF